MSGRHRVAVASSSRLAADAAPEIADLGGNAVDCAIASAMVAMNSEPGVCSLAGGAYVTVWPPGGDPVTIDGGVAVPGLAIGDDYQPDSGVPLHMEYGGGVDTIVGCRSVGVPGALSACDHAARRFGAIDWKHLIGPAIRAAREGFPLPGASHYYLEYSGIPIYCRSPDGERALFNDNGQLRAAGDSIVVPGLADSLEAIADEGAESFYKGDLARRMVEHVRDGGGLLTATDLSDFRPLERPALTIDLDDWSIAVNPPPAVGGSVLAALLLLAKRQLEDTGRRPAEIADAIVAAQLAALRYRKEHLDLGDNVSEEAARLLKMARDGTPLGKHMSSATVHTSAVDDTGLACSITSSAGYGSGEIPPGTGLWLNNCIGELELNRRGLDAGPPGSRLPSNMTPGAARRGDAVLAFGSPGADRITTALQQFLLFHLVLGQEIDGANAAPRLHVEVRSEDATVSAEPGAELGSTKLPSRVYPDRNMYFGGVGAASFDGQEGLEASGDPRRVGGTFVSP